MQAQSKIGISKITLVVEGVLQVQFNRNWSIDDYAQLSEYLLSITSAQTLEHIQGADLQCLRLQFENAQLMLTFEEYSQSCWFECATTQDQQALLSLQQVLLRALP